MAKRRKRMLKIALILLAVFVICGLVMTVVEVILGWFDIGNRIGLGTIWLIILVYVVIAVPIGTAVIWALDQI